MAVRSLELTLIALRSKMLMGFWQILGSQDIQLAMLERKGHLEVDCILTRTCLSLFADWIAESFQWSATSYTWLAAHVVVSAARPDDLLASWI